MDRFIKKEKKNNKKFNNKKTTSDRLVSDIVPDDTVSKPDKIYRILTKRGYSFLKDEIPVKQLEKIKQQLSVKPNVNTDYGPAPPSFKIYLESQTKLYIPKHYALREFGEPQHIKLNTGETKNFNFVGELRDKQIPVVTAFMDSCDTTKPYTKASRGGIISVPCGFGKTVIALYLLSEMRKKTLVIVHKEFLVNQWKERIGQYLPDAKIGIIQGNNYDIDDCDIVIGMLQSISMKDYPESLFQDFGFCIVDECHHIAAEVFSRSLYKVNCQFMLGLSATPKRKDGLSKVFEWFLGPYVFIDKTKREVRKVETTMVHYRHASPLYCREEMTGFGKTCIPRMITNVCNFTRRTYLIVGLVKYLLENAERCILVLSDRIEHLRIINKLLRDGGETSVGFYIGGMKEAQLKASESCRVILGSYSMSSEGMDIPCLNTLILASPKSEIEQSIGRILRRPHETVVPSVYDIVDNFSIFRNQAMKRRSFYEKKEYSLFTSLVDDLDNVAMSELLANALNTEEIISKAKKRAITNKKEEINGESKKCLIFQEE